MINEQLFLRIPAILLILTIHEYAHGWIAYRRGDMTAKTAGRLTFNPFAHLDPFGTLMLLFGPFGWARPVPVNPAMLNDPRKDSILVSAAGPASNIITAIVAGNLMQLIYRLGIPALHYGTFAQYLQQFTSLFININLGIAFFNLLPVPPLDGSKILMGFLPPERVESYMRLARHVPFVFLALIVGEWMFNIPLISRILYPLYMPFRAFWFMFIVT